MLLYRVNGPLRQLAFVDGLYPQDTWSGSDVTYVRHDCRGGTLAVELQSDPALFIEPNVVTARDRRARRRPRRRRPARARRSAVPLERDGDTCTVRFTVARTAVPAVVIERREPRPAAARHALQPLHVPALMRIAFDVSPLSHPRSGIGTYLRGSLAGLAEAAARRARDRRLRADEPAGQEGDPGGAGRDPGRRLAPASCRSRTSGGRAGAGSGGRGVERFLGPIDVLHFSDWMYPPQRARRPGDDRPRPRAAALPRVGAGPHAPHAHGEVPRTPPRRATSLFANSAFTAREVGRAARRARGARARRASRASTRCSRPTASGPISARRTSSPSRRSSRGRTSARSSRRTRCSAATTCGSRSSARRAGASSRRSTGRASSGSATSTTTSSRGSTAARRCSSIRRGSRASGCRWSRRWRAARPSSARRTSRWTRLRRCGALRADPESPEAFAAAIERALARSRRARRARRGARGALLVARDGPRVPRRLRGGALMRVGLDVSPLDQTRAGTARYIDEPRGASPASSSSALRRRGSGRAATIYRDAVWYPSSCRVSRARQRLDVLHCPTFRGPLRPTGVPARRHRPRPRRPPPPGGVQRVDAALQPPLRAARRACGDARDRRLRVHEARARRAARRRRRRRSRRAERRRRACSRADGPAAEGDYVLAVGTLEPRKNLARVDEAARRLGVELRVVGAARLGRRRRAGLARPRLRRGARAPLPRRALPRLPVALRGLRAADRRGDGVRHAGRDERAAARPRRWPAARRCSSTRSTSLDRRRDRARRSARRDELRRLGLERARAPSAGTRPRARRSRSTARRLGVTTPLVVIDADVLGRQRTGDETYVENLLRRLPAAAGDELRFAALTRRPDLVPDGVEPVHVPARLAGAAHGLVRAARARAGCDPRSRTSSTRCRSAARARPSSRSTTSRSSATRP